MPGKVLKIDVVIDESGDARRAAAELETNVKRLDERAGGAKAPIDRLNTSVARMAHEADDAALGVKAANAEVGAGTVLIGGYSAGMIAAGAAAAALVINAAAVAAIFRESTRYYLEQSDVLDVNKQAVSSLATTWDNLKYAIGQAIIGTDGDFRTWIDVVNGGLAIMGSKLAANIELAGLARWGLGMESGKDTRRHEMDGSLTEFGKQGLSQYIIDSLEDEIVLRDVAKRELAEYNAESARTMQATDVLLKNAKAYLQTQRELADELRRVATASHDAFDAEIASAYMDNLQTIKGLTADIRQDYAAIALTGSQLKAFQINEAAGAARGDVDPRAENAAGVFRQIEAQRQLQLLGLKQETGGLTEELRQQFLAFRDTYQDVLGGIPDTLEGILPEVQAASGSMRATLTGDMEAVGSQATQTSQMIAVVFQRTASELRAQAQQITNDLNDMIGKGQTGPFGYMQFEQERADRLRRQASLQDTHSTAPWGTPRFADGVTNFGGGVAVVGERGPELVRLPRGSDVLPHGRGLGSVSVTIDARGAQFTSEAAIEQLADRVQQKLAPMFGRFTGS